MHVSGKVNGGAYNLHATSVNPWVLLQKCGRGTVMYAEELFVYGDNRPRKDSSSTVQHPEDRLQNVIVAYNVKLYLTHMPQSKKFCKQYSIVEMNKHRIWHFHEVWAMQVYCIAVPYEVL